MNRDDFKGLEEFLEDQEAFKQEDFDLLLDDLIDASTVVLYTLGDLAKCVWHIGHYLLKHKLNN